LTLKDVATALNGRVFNGATRQGAARARLPAPVANTVCKIASFRTGGPLH